MNVHNGVWNMGNDCSNRKPSETHYIREISGESLIAAQGEDVVAGKRTPQERNQESQKRRRLKSYYGGYAKSLNIAF